MIKINKYKVFLANGTVQTVVAHGFTIDWNNGTATLRFSIGDVVTAIFPPNGWHGVQDMEIFKKVAL